MHRVFREAVALLAALSCPSIAAAQVDHWAPAFSAAGGIVTEKWDARGDSEPRIPFEGETNAVFPLVGFSADLMAPALLHQWGRPRLFLHGDLALSFDSGWNTAKENSQGRVRIPIIDVDMNGVPDIEPSVISATGTGSTARHEAQPLRLSAGVGIAFTLEILGRTVRLRPSVEYQWQQVEFSLAVSDAESIAGDEFCPCRILQLSSRETRSFHGIGPGLELELDAGRAGPFALSVFANMRGYYTPGERDVRLRANQQYDDGKPAMADARFERGAWSFNNSFGLRFRWQPE